MKPLILFLFSLLLSVGLHAQSVMLNDVTRANPPSSRNSANALDVMKPYTASGTDTYTVSILSGTLYAGSATYVDGDMFTIVFTNANTSTTVTLNINSEGAIAVKDNDGTDPDVGGIAGALKVRYNGTHFRVVGSSGTGVGGGLEWGDITGTLPDQGDLQLALDLKAPLASPVLTGNPTAPNQSAGTNNTRIANTAYADAKVADAINNGTTSIAPSQNAVFDALCIITAVQKTVSTAGGTITLDFNDSGCDKQVVSFIGTGAFSGPKTFALSNLTNALSFQFTFTITDLAAVPTVPSDWAFEPSDSWSGTTYTFTSTGTWVFGGDWDGTNWNIKVGGPFTN